MQKLGLTPGSVSPFGLLNDVKNEVQLYIHRDVCEAELVGFHPNDNTATVVLTKQMFRKYLELMKREILITE